MSKHEYSDIRIPIELDNPSIRRDESKCIKCGQCKRVCENEIAVGKMYQLSSTMDTAICIHCGQCANVCPVDSITEVWDYEHVKAAIKDPDKIVIFSTSPSVRVALGEEFNMEPGAFVEEQMVSALRVLGADYVLDTNFSADLTIMEEAAELVERITNKVKPLPQFTSCCPAWVKFIETFYPEFIPNISTVKSPIGMQGPTIKTYFAKNNKLDPSKIINVALTPCTAKKYEIKRPEMNASASYNDIPDLRDMDYVITTRELARWLKEEGYNLADLEPAIYDPLMGAASGAGIIFGNTGGVMEAAVRTAYHFITKEEPPKELLKFEPVRGMDGIREASISIDGILVKTAIVHGTSNAKVLLDRIKSGEVTYDFIEVMTCRGGCIGGGGQPKTEIPMSDTIRNKRIQGLYSKDEQTAIRTSHENPDIIKVYNEFFGAPLSDLAETILHTIYNDKSASLGDGIIEEEETITMEKELNTTGKKRFECNVCGYIEEDYNELPADYTCPVCGVGPEDFTELV